MTQPERASDSHSFAERNLITPTGMLVTTALLAIYAMYAGWMAYVWTSPFYGIAAALAASACIGAALVKPWAQPPLHLLTAVFAFGWFRSIYDGVRSGYFDSVFDSWTSIAAAVAPGAALLAIAAASSVLVHRQFRRASSEPV